MLRLLSVLIAASLLLSGCATVAESRLNPFNWFGGGAERSAPSANADNPLIPARRTSIFRDDADERYLGTLVAEVTELRLEERPGGVVLRTEARAARTGAHDVRLVPVETETAPGVLVLEFRAVQPRGTSAQPQRLTAALWITDQDLFGVDRVEVRSAGNTRILRR